MADMTPQEQLMLELINRARMDPAGEAKRFGIKLNEGVDRRDRISDAPKQVLAGNDDLQDAADGHSDWMLQNDRFSHTQQNGTPGFTGRNPDDRMENAGYDFTGNWRWGENIAESTIGGGIDITDAIIKQHKLLFVDKGVAGRGHRTNILEAGFQEIGIGQETSGNTAMVTQDFARTGSNVFVTGVVYDDTTVDDDFFTVDEETAGVAVTADGANDTTGSGGGYELRFDAGAGAKTITYVVAGMNVTIDLTLGARNVKVDVVNRTEIWTDTSIASTSSTIMELHALGIGKVNFDGASHGQEMYGNKAANRLEGNGGGDTLIGGRGKDELHGDAGADIFVFAKGDTGKTNAKADVIADFTQLDNDVIDLTAWDANSRQNGDQAFTFIEEAKFHKEAGELRYVIANGDTFIQGDTNGDGKADLVIRLDGEIDLAPIDINL